MDSSENAEARQTVLDSLEKRWHASDQLVFIMSVLLNPYIKSAVFNTTSPATRIFFSVTNVVEAAGFLYYRFFGVAAPPNSIYSNYEDYLKGIGEYKGLKLSCDQVEARAKNEVNKYIECYYLMNHFDF